MIAGHTLSEICGPEPSSSSSGPARVETFLILQLRKEFPNLQLVLTLPPCPQRRHMHCYTNKHRSCARIRSFAKHVMLLGPSMIWTVTGIHQHHSAQLVIASCVCPEIIAELARHLLLRSSPNNVAIVPKCSVQDNRLLHARNASSKFMQRTLWPRPKQQIAA